MSTRTSTQERSDSDRWHDAQESLSKLMTLRLKDLEDETYLPTDVAKEVAPEFLRLMKSAGKEPPTRVVLNGDYGFSFEHDAARVHQRFEIYGNGIIEHVVVDLNTRNVSRKVIQHARGDDHSKSIVPSSAASEVASSASSDEPETS